MRLRILLAAVFLLGIFLFFRPGPADFALSKTSPDTAKSIRIERSGMPPIRIEKRASGWEILSPSRAPADPGAVRAALAILEAKSDRRLDSKDLSRFGLEPPSLRVFVDSEEFDFGMLNPLTGQQYVKKGDSVYLISAKYALIPPLSEMEAHLAGAS